MACPHSTARGSSPETCSQCLGVVARQITRDEDTGKLLLDGTVIDRPFAAPAQGRGYGRDTKSTLKGEDRRCGLCGKQDHTRQNCGVKGAEVS